MSSIQARRRTLAAAAAATKQMDDLLMPAIEELRVSVHDGNGAAIYFSHHRVRDAMSVMADNIKKAQEIYRATAWPTDEDYD